MADFEFPGKHLYKGVVMTPRYPAEILDRVPDFEFRPSDLLIATYTKSGTTWLQHIAYLIVNDADVDTSRNVALNECAPFLEMYANKDLPPNIDRLSQMKSPRVIKTHLYYSFFKESIEGIEKPKFKTIVGMRNVRDVLVSYYHFHKVSTKFPLANDFETFFKIFKQKGLIHGDYFDFNRSWWAHKDDPNIHFVKYEDMKKDLRGEIMKIASFLGKTLSDTQLNDIVSECTFKSMQTNLKTNNESSSFKMDTSKFLRKGEIGDWANHMSEEQVEYLNRRCEEELIPHGLEFEYM